MRSLILLPTFVCLILIVAHRARGFSSGAPEESCDSLAVNHTHVGSPSPGAECDATCRQARQLRWIGNSADSFTYNCNETYQLQLTTTADVSLNGYMVAPREDTGAPLDGNVPYVGSWESGTDLKLLCNGQAVTQSRALVATTTVNMMWKAPMGGRKNVAFWFVTVPSTAFYYLPVKSLTAIPNPAECSCNPICLNGGTINEESCQCDCPDYYNGDNCEHCSRICQNGGTLNEEACMCDCADGFSGDNCESCALVCENGGSFTTGTCVCECVNGFTGPTCGICRGQNCQNGGTRNESTCTCDCADGYSGDTCGLCSRVCQNGGTLDAESCKCDCSGARGFGGPNCEICKSRNCQNGGVLNVDTCTCDCADGYSGDTCGICSRACQNGGTLDAESCMCDCSGGFDGPNCETCPVTCENGGTLNAVTCTCDCADGYSGDTCRTSTCNVRTCENGGTLDTGTCTCTCTAVFTGSSCETLELALVVGPTAAFVVLIVFTIIIAVIVIVQSRRYRAVCCRSIPSSAPGKGKREPHPDYSYGHLLNKSKT